MGDVYEALLGLEGWPPGADTYSAADGTSFSTPLVAGYLALVRSRHPTATLVQLRDELRANALDLAPAGYDASSGFGRLRMVVPAELGGSGNQAPVADILGDQSGRITVADTGKSGQESVTLDGTGSSDPDGQVVAYRWSWTDAQGEPRTGSGSRLTVVLNTGVQYALSLTVEDDRGAVSAPDNVLVAGYTSSSGWVSGGFDTSYNGGSNGAFVAKLSGTGAYLWSTYLSPALFNSHSINSASLG